MADDSTIEARVRTALDDLRIPYTLIPCDPALADTAAFCAHYHYGLDESANTIVVASRKDPSVACACVALATTRLDVNHTVCDLLGVRKASFASPELTSALTDMRIGGVTPFGLPESLPLFVDAAVCERDQVIVGGGSRSLKLQLSGRDLSRLPSAKVISGLAAPAATTA